MAARWNWPKTSGPSSFRVSVACSHPHLTSPVEGEGLSQERGAPPPLVGGAGAGDVGPARGHARGRTSMRRAVLIFAVAGLILSALYLLEGTRYSTLDGSEPCFRAPRCAGAHRRPQGGRRDQARSGLPAGPSRLADGRGPIHMEFGEPSYTLMLLRIPSNVFRRVAFPGDFSNSLSHFLTYRLSRTGFFIMRERTSSRSRGLPAKTL